MTHLHDHSREHHQREDDAPLLHCVLQVGADAVQPTRDNYDTERNTQIQFSLLCFTKAHFLFYRAVKRGRWWGCDSGLTRTAALGSFAHFAKAAPWPASRNVPLKPLPIACLRRFQPFSTIFQPGVVVTAHHVALVVSLSVGMLHSRLAVLLARWRWMAISALLPRSSLQTLACYSCERVDVRSTRSCLSQHQHDGGMAAAGGGVVHDSAYRSNAWGDRAGYGF